MGKAGGGGSVNERRCARGLRLFAWFGLVQRRRVAGCPGCEAAKAAGRGSTRLCARGPAAHKNS